MKTRHLTLPLALSLALAAPSLQAMGLGQLQVKSGLNQPLVAEIPILSATPAELEQLDVRLASPEAFSRVGLERPAQLTANLQFSVGKNSRGQPVIRVSTPGKFQEPFLSFLIEADWGKGAVTREYTALIDPPYIAPAVIRPMSSPAIAPAVATAPPPPPMPSSPPVREPEPARPQPVREPEPVAVAPTPAPPPVFEPAPAPEPVAEAASPPQPEPARPEPQPEPVAAPPMPAPVAAAGEVGPINAGQTLWSIANAARPDDSVSVNQMMLALLRANPDAFDQDNINRLKSGSVLRIPSREEATSLSPEQAAVLVREQASAWRTPRQPVPQPADSVAEQPDATTSPEPAAAPPPRVASRPASSGRSASRLEIVPPAGRSSARGAQSGASAGAGGTELRAQLVQAREDLAARNAEITELKSQVADLEKMNTDRQHMIDVQNSDLKALQDRLKQLEDQQAAAATQPAAATVAAPTAGPAPLDAAAPDPAAANPAPAPEATPIYMNPYVLGGGGLLLLGGLVFALRSRKRSSDEVVEAPRRISDDVALRASLAQTRVGKAVPADAAPPAPAPTPAPKPEPAPVAKKDTQLDSLTAAVRSRPQDLEAHLSLLRLFHSRGNSADYEAAAQAMRMHVPSTMDPRWREAVIMGASLMPGHPLFSQAGWNATAAAPAPAPARAPEPAPAAVAPTPAPAPMIEPEPELEDLSFADTNFHSDNDGGASDDYASTTAVNIIDQGELDRAAQSPVDLHRNEAELMAEDEASATRIELAKAYLDIGDLEGARSMLEEVMAEGGPTAKAAAQRILKEIG